MNIFQHEFDYYDLVICAKVLPTMVFYSEITITLRYELKLGAFRRSLDIAILINFIICNLEIFAYERKIKL